MKMIRPVVITEAMFTASNLTETDEGEYNPAANYATGQRVMVVAEHRLYESLKDNNIGNSPPDNIGGEEPWWKDVGATNKWRAFDRAEGNQATDPASLEYTIEPGSIVDCFSLRNLEAVEAQVIMTDPAAGEVYNSTFDLISTENVVDWWSYFFEPILRIGTLTIFDLPPFPDAAINIIINNGGSTVKCGEIVIGKQRDIGKTLVLPGAGFTDYSTKDANPDSGDFTVRERPYSKTLSCDVRIDNREREDIYREIIKYRATPLVWLALDNYGSLDVYGFCRDFNMVLSYPSCSEYSLEIEGLT